METNLGWRPRWCWPSLTPGAKARAVLITIGYLGVAWWDELNAARLDLNPWVPWWILFVIVAVAGWLHRTSRSRFWHTVEVAVLMAALGARGTIYALNANWSIVALMIVFLIMILEGWLAPQHCPLHDQAIRQIQSQTEQLR